MCNISLLYHSFLTMDIYVKKEREINKGNKKQQINKRKQEVIAFIQFHASLTSLNEFIAKAVCFKSLFLK